MPYDDIIIKRFWENVAVCDHGRTCDLCCWPWLGAKNEGTYGVLSVYNSQTKGPRNFMAHRVAWELLHNQHIPPGLWGLHRCNFASCCNGFHIYPGTAQDNADDMVMAGRQTKGMDHWTNQHPERLFQRARTKLSRIDVQQIRHLVFAGFTHRVVAEIFHISHSHVTEIVSRKKWHDVL